MDIATAARRYSSAILTGNLLAIDPASGGTSDPGYACYVNGALQASGTIPLKGKDPIYLRLGALYLWLHGKWDVDVLVVERIRGKMAHEFLRWAVGVTVAAVQPRLLFEMPVPTWKKLAGKHHVKTDENDAIAIGDTMISLAGGLAA